MSGDSGQTVLLVDDDAFLGAALKDFLSDRGLRVHCARTGSEALAFLSRQSAHVVLLDQKLPDAEGHRLCGEMLRLDDQLKIIFITAYPSFENAVVALRAGAHDYVCKPFTPEEVEIAVRRALRTEDLERTEQVQRYQWVRERERAARLGPLPRPVLQAVEMASRCWSPVLITGETGTGKNVVARAIHCGGETADRPFLSVNCTVLPEGMAEAELFGHMKGAFTGAVTGRKGLFELADGGTLLLDEIGAMPLLLQPKLLSVLDDGAVRRIGGETFHRVKVRIISATNSDLDASVRERRFREDLYFRLCVIRIHLPPLRDRREDFGTLCRQIVDDLAPGVGQKLAADQIDRLENYHWPGNVRELRNVLERAVILANGGVPRPADLLMAPLPAAPPPDPAAEPPLLLPLAEVEEHHLRRVLAAHGGNLTRSAETLGIAISTLKRRLKRIRLHETDRTGRS